MNWLLINATADAPSCGDSNVEHGALRLVPVTVEAVVAVVARDVSGGRFGGWGGAWPWVSGLRCWSWLS